jgi:hypothetical protein
MNQKNIQVRKGQAPGKLSRDDFRARFFDKFTDPAFGAEASALTRIVCNVARAVANAVRELRAGHLSQPDDKLEAPRQK